jgi:hypothetical protein
MDRNNDLTFPEFGDYVGTPTPSANRATIREQGMASDVTRQWENIYFFKKRRTLIPFSRRSPKNDFKGVEKIIRSLSPIKFISEPEKPYTFREVMYGFYLYRYMELIERSKFSTEVVLESGDNVGENPNGSRRTILDGFRIVNFYFPKMSFREFLDKFICNEKITQEYGGADTTHTQFNPGHHGRYYFYNKPLTKRRELFYFFRCPDIGQYVFETSDGDYLLNTNKFNFITD